MPSSDAASARGPRPAAAPDLDGADPDGVDLDSADLGGPDLIATTQAANRAGPAAAPAVGWTRGAEGPEGFDAAHDAAPDAAQDAAAPARGDLKVLVVDDSALQRKLLASALQAWGYIVIEAESGAEALALCRSDPPDIVLSDWMMPGMTGLELCRAFRALERAHYGYFILLTARADREDATAGLEAGADDFLAKPFHRHELRARLQAGARVLQMEGELLEKNRLIARTLAELQSFNVGVEADLDQARLVQRSMMQSPRQDFGAARVDLLLEPCGQVGGDLVGCFAATPAYLGIYGLDVSGHGIASALMAARVSGHLGCDFPEQNIALAPPGARSPLRPPEEVARLLNDRLAPEDGSGTYLTLLYGALELGTGRLVFVQAGHPPPLLIPAEGPCRFLGAGGMPVGLLQGAHFEAVEVALAPGDSLLIYSDGLTEAELPGQGQLGREGLLALVQACRGAQPAFRPGLQDPALPEDFLPRLLGSVKAKMAGAAPEDDISAALLRFTG